MAVCDENEHKKKFSCSIRIYRVCMCLYVVAVQLNRVCATRFGIRLSDSSIYPCHSVGLAMKKKQNKMLSRSASVNTSTAAWCLLFFFRCEKFSRSNAGVKSSNATIFAFSKHSSRSRQSAGVRVFSIILSWWSSERSSTPQQPLWN